jgi:hypothetical protein
MNFKKSSIKTTRLLLATGLLLVVAVSLTTVDMLTSAANAQRKGITRPTACDGAGNCYICIDDDDDDDDDDGCIVRRASNGSIICVEGDDDDDDCRVVRTETGIPRR